MTPPVQQELARLCKQIITEMQSQLSLNSAKKANNISGNLNYCPLSQLTYGLQKGATEVNQMLGTLAEYHDLCPENTPPTMLLNISCRVYMLTMFLMIHKYRCEINSNGYTMYINDI